MSNLATQNKITPSGVYFIDDGHDYVRIGESVTVDTRINVHKGSTGKKIIIDILETIPDKKVTKYEETLAQNYFKEYHSHASFYDRKIIKFISDYCRNRKLEILGLKDKINKRSGKVSTLFGMESINSLMPPCDMFPHLPATYMDRIDKKNGLKPRQIMLDGKRLNLSSAGKNWYQQITRNAKEQQLKQIRAGRIKNYTYENKED